MPQTKLTSLTEALANIVISSVIMFAGQLIIFPLVGLDVSWGQNFEVWGLFTVVSVIRLYCVRRWFNRKEALRNLQKSPPEGGVMEKPLLSDSIIYTVAVMLSGVLLFAALTSSSGRIVVGVIVGLFLLGLAVQGVRYVIYRIKKARQTKKPDGPTG